MVADVFLVCQAAGREASRARRGHRRDGRGAWADGYVQGMQGLEEAGGKPLRLGASKLELLHFQQDFWGCDLFTSIGERPALVVECSCQLRMQVPSESEDEAGQPLSQDDVSNQGMW